MFNPLALLFRMAAASRSSEMDHADVDVAALVLPVVLIEASGRAIRMVKKAVKAVSTSRAIAKALVALSANRLMVNVVDVAAVAAVAVASVVVAAAMIVVVAVASDVVVAVAEIAVDAVVSDVVVVDAAAVVALATNHLTQRQSKTRKLLLTIKKSILS